MGDLIRTTAELEAACARLREEGLAAIDTEFVWMRTYRPCLGIVQLGCRAGCWAVDCMTAIDTSALKALVGDPSVVKILHDARQDLTHIRHWTDAAPHNVFDTQVAAAFAGFPSGIGLQRLLQEALDVGLAKTETRTDWTQRPLSDAQVRYALDDVRYLPDLRDELRRRSRELGTLDWMDEEQLRHDDPVQYDDPHPDAAWLRIKTRRVRLDGRGRASLRALAEVREETARKWNLPRAWLGDDDSLVRMADEGRAGRFVHRLRGGQVDTMRVLYASALSAAAALAETDCPEDPRRHYIREVEEAAESAWTWLGERAEKLHVDVAAIASRATVTAFVDDVGDESNPLASGWRHAVAGEEMARLFGVD